MDDNGAVLTLPCTMETVYGGMLYNQTLAGLRRVRLARLFVGCLTSFVRFKVAILFYFILFIFIILFYSILADRPKQTV